MSIFPGDEPDSNPSQQSTYPLVDAAITTKKHFAPYDGVPPINEVITVATENYLAALDPDDPPEPRLLERQLLSTINNVIKMANARAKAQGDPDKLPLKGLLTCWQIARILHRLYIIKEVVPDGVSAKDDGVGVLGIYQTSGPDRGIYRPCEYSGVAGKGNAPSVPGLASLVQDYNASIDEKGYKEVRRLVRMFAERATESTDPDLIPMANTIVNYRTNERIPFSPEHVFLAKFDTALPEQRPELPRIADDQCDGGFWEVESWTEQTHPNRAWPSTSGR